MRVPKTLCSLLLPAVALPVATCLADQTYQLDTINPAFVQQDWGEAHAGQDVDGHPMVMGGRTFSKGIGTHANSIIEINLDGKATEFTATVGVSDDQKGTQAKVKFLVEGDGKRLWTSGAIAPGNEPRKVSIKLEGVHALTLRVTAATGNISNDHANWADAAITYSGAAPAPAGSDLSITTDHLRFNFVSRRDGMLRLTSAGTADDTWRAPLQGLAWTGDCKTHDAPIAIRRANGDGALDLVYENQQSRDVADGVKEEIVTLRDKVDPLRVELHFRAFAHEDVIQQWTVFRNDLPNPVRVTRLDSAYWEAPADSNPCLEWYASKWAGEAAQPQRERLAKGCRVLEGHDGERHIDGPVPAFVLSFGDLPDEEKTPCLIAALAWSGDARFAFDMDSADQLAVTAGVRQDTSVAPGGTLSSPVCIYSLSPAGKGTASRNLQQWGRKFGIRDGDRLRLIDNNSWEGCGFDLSEKAVLDMMKGSADLGIELYVLDDGWFGNGPDARTGDSSGLGDWQINKERFPNGLKSILDEAAKDGMHFGIWFEPEMVNPRSDLYRQHPDWVLRDPGHELQLQRNQAVLDLANPAVQDFVFRSVDDLLETYPAIRFIKWDCNSNINNPYSPSLGPERQGDLLTRYMAGYYGALQKLVLKHPGVDFQACASGSGRGDYGAMQFSHTFWVSDNTNPMFRLGAQWDYSTFLPAMAETCHVTHSGNYEPKFRFDVAMMGQLGMEIDPRKSEPAFQAAAKTGIAAYKSVREIVQFGNQYRHGSPFDSETPSLNYVSQDRTRALVLAYEIGEKTRSFNVPVSGLDPAKSYKLAEINLPPGDDRPRLAPAAKNIATGREWMDAGIPVVFTRDHDSAALTLEATR